MTIADKIQTVFQTATGLRMLYGTREAINRELSYGSMPCGFFVLQNSSVTADGGRLTEKTEAVVSVITKTAFDAEAYENEALIAECKAQVFRFLQALQRDGLVSLEEVLRSERIYDEFDDIVTGYSVTIRLADTTVGCGDAPGELFQAKAVTPSGFEQIVLPDDGFLALSKVTVAAVTAEVDPNIQPGNIKDGVSILGVAGTLEDPQIWIDRYEEAERVIGVQSEQIAEGERIIAEQDQTIAEQGQTISTALTDLNATNGTDETSLASATDVAETSRQAIAEAITAKGVDVPEGTGLADMASKVEQIQSGGIDPVWKRYFFWALGKARSTTYKTPSFFDGAELIDEYNDVTDIADCAMLGHSLACFESNSAIKINRYAFSMGSPSNDFRLIVPNAKRGTSGIHSWGEDTTSRRIKEVVCGFTEVISNDFNNSRGIERFTTGRLVSFAQPSSAARIEFLRYFCVGHGTDININFARWTATSVIAEGEAAQLELIANARAGLFERVADHTGEADARSITAAWVNTLMDSQYMSVVDALLDLIVDFADKGWSLGG